MQREAAWAVTNLTAGGTKAQTMELVNYGVIEPFCKLLAIQDAKVGHLLFLRASQMCVCVCLYIVSISIVLCVSGRASGCGNSM